MNKNLELIIVQKRIRDLILAEYNPRRATKKEEDQLIESIKRFGFVDPVVVNINPDRKNVIVGGNLRTGIAKEMGYNTVPCVEVNLTIEREKELNLRLNKNTGSWDEERYVGNFTKDLMIEVGFKENELKMYLSEYERRFETKTEKSKYPIVAKLSEKYNYVVIIAENEVDLAYLENFFELKREASYKNRKVGIGRGVRFEDFKKKVENERIKK